MQESCTAVSGKFCSSLLSSPCFLHLSQPLPTLIHPSCCSLLISLFLFLLTMSSLFCSDFPFDSLPLLCLDHGYLFWLFLFLLKPPPSYFSSQSIFLCLSSIWLFISPITAIFLRFPFRPWNHCLRGISLLVCHLYWMRLWHCIFRAIRSLRRCVLHQSRERHPQKNMWNMQVSFHPTFAMDGAIPV